jgi:hypothetical protein
MEFLPEVLRPWVGSIVAHTVIGVARTRIGATPTAIGVNLETSTSERLGNTRSHRQDSKSC